MQNKVVLVTGGSRGIGAAIVRRFAEEKTTVYFTYHASKEAALKLVAECSPKSKVFAMPCDSANKADIETLVEKILETEQEIHVLVNNAGIIRDGLFLSMSDEDWSDVLRTNLDGVYYFCKALARPMMMQRYGRIVNISSIVGELGGYGQANYAASKAAVNALTKSLAGEFASRGITVNAVAPGMVETDMTESVRGLMGDAIKEKIPVGFYAKPEDIANAVYFLAQNEAKYITGQVLTVDGGISLLARR